MLLESKTSVWQSGLDLTMVYSADPDTSFLSKLTSRSKWTCDVNTSRKFESDVLSVTLGGTLLAAFVAVSPPGLADVANAVDDFLVLALDVNMCLLAAANPSPTPRASNDVASRNVDGWLVRRVSIVLAMVIDDVAVASC